MSFNLLLRSAPPSLSLINPQRPLFTLASSVNNGHSIGHYFYCNTRRINPILGRISKSQPSSTAHPRSKSFFSSLSHPWCWCKVKVVQPSQEQSSIRTLNSYLHSPCFITLVRQWFIDWKISLFSIQWPLPNPNALEGTLLFFSWPRELFPNLICLNYDNVTLLTQHPFHLRSSQPTKCLFVTYHRNRQTNDRSVNLRNKLTETAKCCKSCMFCLLIPMNDHLVWPSHNPNNKKQQHRRRMWMTVVGFCLSPDWWGCLIDKHTRRRL